MNTTPPASSFLEFPKLARLSREATISEKIDGSNTQLFIWDEEHTTLQQTDAGELYVPVGPPPADVPFFWSSDGLHLAVGSRTQWVKPGEDNHGVAKWTLEHAQELATGLGHGRHFGEWWGSGIQRGYGLIKGEKRLSLFNVHRWCLHDDTPKLISAPDAKAEKWQEVLPPCVGLVPILARGMFTTEMCSTALERLRTLGSVAAPGFMKPEGIVVWHSAANMGFKKTLEKDDVPKSLA